MRQWTYAEIKRKIEIDLDLQEELFITPEEIQGYINEAIDEAEAEILGIHEDYFLTSRDTPVVSGQDQYALPPDIFANKIRAVTFNDGTNQRTIRRVRNLSLLTENYPAGKPESYILLNPTPSAEGPVGAMITLFPRPDSSGTLRVWYLRNAQHLQADTDVCDIPEFVNFVIQYAKVRCYEKEAHPNAGEAMIVLEKQRQLMISTLSDMIPDEDNTLRGDMSFYSDHR